jgi:hypothetical protein
VLSIMEGALSYATTLTDLSNVTAGLGTHQDEMVHSVMVTINDLSIFWCKCLLYNRYK